MHLAYWYAFKKILILKSSWIILAISIALISYVSGVLPYNLVSLVDKIGITYGDTAINRLATIIGLYTSITISSLLIATFAAFRGATLIRSELEDSSFLVQMAKPISRSSLLFAKYAAYLTAVWLFTIIIAIAHHLAMYFTDGGVVFNSARILFISLGCQLGITLVLALIFMSVTMMGSLYLSSAMTIGLTIGLAFVAPLSSVFQIIDKDESAKSLGSVRSLYGLDDIEVEIMARTQSPVEIKNVLIGSFLEMTPSDYAASQYLDWSFSRNFTTISEQAIFAYEDLKKALEITEVENRVSEVKKVMDREVFYMESNPKSIYNYLSVIDFTYHHMLLSSITTQKILEDDQQSATLLTELFSMGGSNTVANNLSLYKRRPKSSSKISSVDKDKKVFQPIYENLEKIERIILDGSIGVIGGSTNNGIAAMFYDNSNNIADSLPASIKKNSNSLISSFADYETEIKQWESIYTQMEFSDYLNRYGVLAVYIAISMIFVIVSYVFMYRKDFR